MKNGWIKLHRKITSWEWYSDVNTFHIFLTLLLMANHKNKRWRGVMVHQGEVCTGFRALAKISGLTVRQTRTSIKRLKSTHEITQRSTHKYTIFSITNWDTYQTHDSSKDTVKKAPADTQVTQ